MPSASRNAPPAMASPGRAWGSSVKPSAATPPSPLLVRRTPKPRWCWSVWVRRREGRQRLQIRIKMIRKPLVESEARLRPFSKGVFPCCAASDRRVSWGFAHRSPLPPPLIAGLAANAVQDDGALALATALEVHPALRLLDVASAQCVSRGALSSQPGGGGGGAGPQNPGSFGAQSFRLTLHQPALSTRPGIFLEGASLQVTFWAPSANPAKPWLPYRPGESAAQGFVHPPGMYFFVESNGKRKIWPLHAQDRRQGGGGPRGGFGGHGPLMWHPLQTKASGKIPDQQLAQTSMSPGCRNDNG